ncbi:hypothetical protein HDU76_006267 [Blyttiomyces sp. JEL0837]|nr:hypothetical protein HDU76_006267 [Blyttiomyces sp. JEL0837]
MFSILLPTSGGGKKRHHIHHIHHHHTHHPSSSHGHHRKNVLTLIAKRRLSTLFLILVSTLCFWVILRRFYLQELRGQRGGASGVVYLSDANVGADGAEVDDNGGIGGDKVIVNVDVPEGGKVFVGPVVAPGRGGNGNSGGNGADVNGKAGVVEIVVEKKQQQEMVVPPAGNFDGGDGSGRKDAMLDEEKEVGVFGGDKGSEGSVEKLKVQGGRVDDNGDIIYVPDRQGQAQAHDGPQDDARNGQQDFAVDDGDAANQQQQPQQKVPPPNQDYEAIQAAMRLAGEEKEMYEAEVAVKNMLQGVDIDLVQVQFIDWLNGEEDAEDPKSVFGGSLANIKTKYQPLPAWELLLDYTTLISKYPYNRTNFIELGRRTRSLQILYKVLHDRKDLHPLLYRSTTNALNSDPNINPQANQNYKKELGQFRNNVGAVIDDLTTLLFPWSLEWRSGIREMQNGFEGRGILITTGGWHFELAIHAIMSLRHLGCNLPVEIHYAGSNDLPDEMADAIRGMPGVYLVNVLEYTGSEGLEILGWAIKPFAMLISRFREVIFVDADALFFQNPDMMMNESVLYRTFGQMFWEDRSLGVNIEPGWFRGFVRFPSLYAEGNRYLRMKSVHEMESGVVVLDKGRTDVLMGLLTVCKLNSRVERDGNTYHMVHGDKETFWIGWEMSRIPYAFVPNFGGTVGYRNPGGEVCGGLFHMDERLKPLWWNGGVLSNKHSEKDKNFIEFEWWATDLSARNLTWIWETSTTPFCLIPSDPDAEVGRLTTEERELTKVFIRLYKAVKGLGWKRYLQDLLGRKSGESEDGGGFGGDGVVDGAQQIEGGYADAVGDAVGRDDEKEKNVQAANVVERRRRDQ